MPHPSNMPTHGMPFFIPPTSPMFQHPNFAYNQPYPPPMPPSTIPQPSNQQDLKAIEDYLVGLLKVSQIRDDNQVSEPHHAAVEEEFASAQPSDNHNDNQPLAHDEGEDEPVPPPTTRHLSNGYQNFRNFQQKAQWIKKNSPAEPVPASPAKDPLLGLQPSAATLEHLAEQASTLFQSLRPLAGEFHRRLKVLSRLQKIITRQWPDANPNLHMFGSSANNFGLRDADMDICLLLDHSKIGSEQKVVTKLAELLRKKQMKQVKGLPKARVPIVKFVDWQSNIRCDICINNSLALHNTRLIAAYAKVDPRVQQLGYVIKYWTKQRQINEPYQGTLSSYAYILMVIQFLQTRNPPVLPVLQQMWDAADTKQRVLVDGYDCYFFNKFDRLLDFSKDNQETVGDLLAAFFRFYAVDFDWENQVVSVRTGKCISKFEKNWNIKAENTRDNYFLTIEDPFEVTHNLGRVVDKDNLKVIQYEFMRAHQLVCSNADLSVICEPYKPSDLQ
eukprot:CAMPEP_0168558782 /NCGR_PEP_ID=MMETSP0413-20121227/10162_1 /TAXON_ID=136452 /ORGANISM="Filamoeba nolandi, Strain NC-AS-23-1" /LENGTH=500 /DNA_ID=CAMNT_0008589943 /DNA_START=213 /DNA_END=1715 /DNA_ORIENTATION=-